MGDRGEREETDSQLGRNRHIYKTGKRDEKLAGRATLSGMKQDLPAVRDHQIYTQSALEPGCFTV